MRAWATLPRGLRQQNVIVRGSTAAFAQEILTGSHRLRAGRDGSCKADTDTGPQDRPLTTFCSCTSMTVAMYARRKSWPSRAMTRSRDIIVALVEVTRPPF